MMDILDTLSTPTGVIGMVVFMLSFIKIPKLEVNIWKWLGKMIGKTLNTDTIERLDKIETALNKHIEKDDLSYAKDCRRDILKFNDEILLNIRHSQEHFTEILEVIDDYENYCREHPTYPNNKAILAIKNIKSTYEKCLKEHNFL